MAYEIKQLHSEDVILMKGLLDCFSHSFEDPETYASNRPDDEYLIDWLKRDHTVVLVALSEAEVVGGLMAYELQKPEQPRSEVYIYDLAVSKPHRRQGVATELIERLKPIANSKGAWVIYVQADHVDQPAVKLYSGLGIREEVLHFDIPIE